MKKVFTFILIIYCSIAYSQKNSATISYADSLFYKKQYTQALEQYEALFDQNKYSPRMLIKMSLIKEGLGDYTYALYYLGIYYSILPERAVLKKMDEIASRYNLQGYEYNDMEFFLSLYNDYQHIIFLIILSLSFIIAVYLYFRPTNKLVSTFLFAIGLLLCIAVVLFVNYKVFPEEAIVNSNAAIMSAPASGSDLVGSIQKGNKVRIINESDIWYRILWNRDFAYIRKHQVLLFRKVSNPNEEKDFLFNFF